MNPSIFPHERRDEIALQKVMRARNTVLYLVILLLSLVTMYVYADAYVAHSQTPGHPPIPLVMYGNDLVSMDSYCAQATRDHRDTGEIIKGDLADVCL